MDGRCRPTYDNFPIDLSILRRSFDKKANGLLDVGRPGAVTLVPLLPVSHSFCRDDSKEVEEEEEEEKLPPGQQQTITAGDALTPS